LWEIYPQSQPADEAAALRNELHILAARMPNWKLDKAGVLRWGTAEAWDMLSAQSNDSPT
jgi:hypothetical protein